jgi:hypothetical protein
LDSPPGANRGNVMHNQSMTQTLIFILTLFYSLTVKADLPGPAFQYDKYSEDGKYYFKSIPYYDYDQTNFGKTIVYDSKTKKELYKIDNYLPTEAFISNTGKTLVTTAHWMWGHSDFEKQNLVEIFINGKSSMRYFINDFVADRSKLQQTSSHTLWYSKMFVRNDTLCIITLEEKVIRIELTKGKIIDKIKKKECKNCNDLDKIPKPKTIYYQDIKYPDGYVFPDLVIGKPFRESLIAGLSKTEVKDYAECKYYIMVYGTIDKTGNCEIFMLSTSVNEIENKDWEKQVSDWVTKQKYKINLIPKNCDKWVFQEYFYLK